ncbi:MAG: hypothetical protein J6V81_00230 [Bacteroidales bacterium]|nr:hypothetical protein [Bacteroidales bacterium]
MKRILLALSILLPLSALAQTQSACLKRVGDEMKVKADIQLTQKMLKDAKTYVLTPQITDGENVVKLSPIGMCSKDKFYPNLKAYGFEGKEGENVYTKKDLPTVVSINESVPYEKWMDGSRLEIVGSYEGCCGDSGEEEADEVASYKEQCIEFEPAFLPTDPEKMKKIETITGEAIIDFPVNGTTLNEKYHKNAEELAKITNSIDQIKAAQQTEILDVIISGTASPEGKYSVNERLAAGRTQAVYNYVVGKYDFPDGIIKAQSVPENWAGLRKFIEASSFKNKADLLDVVDGSLDADAKEAKLRNSANWGAIRNNCLPYLRSTSYSITFKTIDYEATETKVDLAYAEMDKGDYDKAAEYLSTADNSPEAEYARGTLAGIRKDWKSATKHFKNALDGGMEEARPFYEEVSRYQYMRNNGDCCCK